MKHTLHLKLIALTLLLLAAGFAAAADKPVNNPDKSKTGILIISGEGLITMPAKYWDGRHDGILFLISQKIMDALEVEIEKRGTQTESNMNTDPKLDPRTYVVQLILKHKRDGLLQVSINDVQKPNKHWDTHLELVYNSLHYGKNQAGDTVTLGEGMRHDQLLDHETTLNKLLPTLNKITSDFADKLQYLGYI